MDTEKVEDIEQALVLDTEDVIVLSEQEWNTLTNITNNPPAPNDKLKEAATKYKRTIGVTSL